MRIENFLKNLSIEELIEVRDRANVHIGNYEDGFFYHCKVRSYGRNWKENYSNTHAVQELCNQYFGDDGIVDVYTTNPDAKIENYGEVNHIKSVEDYDKWKKSEDLIGLIKSAEERLNKWNDRDNIPFHSRPTFAPLWNEEDILGMRNELESLE
jgi:hypothetical protein